MSFLANSALTQTRAFHPLRLTTPLLAGLAALAIGLAGVTFRGFDDNSLAFGTQLVWRFSVLLFFAALVARPLGRVPPFAVLAGKSRALLQGFCAAMAVYFAFILVPNVFAVPDGVRPAGISAGMTIFVFFTGSVTLVMAAAVNNRLSEKLGDRACRAMLGVAMIYFWLCFSLLGLAHISGPHRDDLFYEASVILMVVGLLARFADRFFENRNPAPAG